MWSDRDLNLGTTHLLVLILGQIPTLLAPLSVKEDNDITSQT